MKERPAARVLLEAPQSAAEIQTLMQQARAGGDLERILAELDRLSRDAEVPIREEAAFRKVQLMLEKQRPGASDALHAVMKRYPEHALVPYASFWVAKWWLTQDESGRALERMKWSLQHKRLTRELADEIFDIAPSITREAPERVAVSWFLIAADVDQGGRDSWLRMAARRASLETIEEMHRDGSLSAELMPLFDLHAGRAYLMTGDRAGVSRIADLLSATMPNHAVVSQLRAWASGEFRAATIGVLLPLSGPYARYGQEALRGLRIALSDVGSDAFITLRVEDTKGESDAAVAAYKRLADESVNMIIGPLLSDTTEALVPHLKSGLPVISLTGRIDLAKRSGSLFIHTLSPLAQVYVMANYAWQHEARRMVVITDSSAEQSEAEMFSSSFEALGGEVLHTLRLDTRVMDQRGRLRELRLATDDDQILAELDEELSVFLPKMDMEMRVPVGFDAVYLALEGRQVSLLAGQLAYADISGVPIYGSSRWQDGHLMDDRGRYLSRARFAASTTSAELQGSDDASLRRFRFAHREAWGSDRTSELMALAYDTMRIAVVMTSRLGLSKSELGRELHNEEGFPAMTGHVRFDESGIGQKQLDIFRIKGGEIVPAG
ncbi:ABC-type branched-chain amino acid transport system, substrate-binding protein [Mariprofundus ferrinatatus]|uniref:ABC-type branched-chain amino acid transport system, substrate-binding protein n=2 Tax=Mariprofundus ferrinatatus TaxID=1921087 RepID=A0A2K8L223_9PROT|nr:ABC-type branched-chain amino acid transport system, substrate-binding protein [Mariprofundus ferrinatatus]